jgi:catechol 2,3-dioxygenase-like lactoylglutathione lyase family enzyme
MLRGQGGGLILGLDHLVLSVADPAATQEFYARTLGLSPKTSPSGRRAMLFGTQKINLHPAGAEFEPKAARPTPGSGDICFVTAADLGRVKDRLISQGVEVFLGPVPREGARGAMESIYFRDLDGNLVEVARYLDEP